MADFLNEFPNDSVIYFLNDLVIDFLIDGFDELLNM